MNAADFYNLERLEGNTESITSNDNPDYNLDFYQNIFRLMNAFALSLIEEIEKEAEIEAFSEFPGGDSDLISIGDLKQILNKYKEQLK